MNPEAKHVYPPSPFLQKVGDTLYAHATVTEYVLYLYLNLLLTTAVSSKLQKLKIQHKEGFVGFSLPGFFDLWGEFVHRMLSLKTKLVCLQRSCGLRLIKAATLRRSLT